MTTNPGEEAATALPLSGDFEDMLGNIFGEFLPLPADRRDRSEPVAEPVAITPEPAVKMATLTATAKPIRQAHRIVWADFVFVAAISLLLAASIFLDQVLPILWPLRLLLAFAYLFLIPGFCFTTALFPRQDDLDNIERAGLSLGLSVVLIPIQALVLNYLPSGLNLTSILVASLASTFLFMFIALVERWRMPDEQAFSLDLHLQPAEVWGKLPRNDRLIFLVLIPVLLLMVGATIWAIKAPETNKQSTEFYILGKEGLAQDYPRQLISGVPQTITAGITNHEQGQQVYSVRVYNGDQLIGAAGPFVIGSGKTVAAPVQFTAVKVGEDVPIDFLLYRGLENEPFRSLQLWLEVKP